MNVGTSKMTFTASHTATTPTAMAADARRRRATRPDVARTSSIAVAMTAILGRRHPALKEVPGAARARVVHVDDLHLAVEIDGNAALLAGADTGGLAPAEGQMGLSADGRVVDVHDADLAPVDELHRLRD